MSYEEIGADIGKLVTEKQKAYGDSFGRSGVVMRALYPNGVGDDQLDDALTVVRVVDKLFRIATNRDALGESPWRDIAGYALLSVKRVEREDRECPHCGIRGDFTYHTASGWCRACVDSCAHKYIAGRCEDCGMVAR